MLLAKVREWFPEIEDSKQDKFEQYFVELKKFNDKINLVSAKTLSFADVIHYSDSILACQIVEANFEIPHVYDFGSGNGFPGLVFSIVLDEVNHFLVERDQRKAEFLKHVVGTLDLKNCQVMCQTLEDLPDGSVEFGIHRGMGNLTEACLAARKVFKKGGKFVHMKGEGWATEVASFPTQLCTYWNPSLIAEYKLPKGEMKFALVRTERL